MVTKQFIMLNDECSVENAKEICNDLKEILEKIGISVDVCEDKVGKMFLVEYDVRETKRKLSRGAGAPIAVCSERIKVVDIRKRMESGESAEKIAKSLGISRSTFFRKLKLAEECDEEYLV